MRKSAAFHTYWGEGWPALEWLEPYFLRRSANSVWAFAEGADDGGNFSAEGMYGTEHLSPKTGRVDVRLYLFGNARHGVYFLYDKWDGRLGRKFRYNSKGDLSWLREYVRPRHATIIPVGLFIPYPVAWKALKEYIERDGELPESIEWIADEDLPPNTFPDPWSLK